MKNPVMVTSRTKDQNNCLEELAFHCSKHWFPCLKKLEQKSQMSSNCILYTKVK